jgi:hypothetical protein
LGSIFGSIVELCCASTLPLIATIVAIATAIAPTVLGQRAQVPGALKDHWGWLLALGVAFVAARRA